MRYGFWAGVLWFLSINAAEWTWLYKKNILTHNNGRFKNASSYNMFQEKTPLFKQLIFSWNAVRPTQGHFTFWVKVRDSQKKTWYPWHKMIEWGADVQKSFEHMPPGGTTYHHVRLQLLKDRHADGFCIKGVAEKGANIGDLRGFFVSLSNFDLFIPEDEHAYLEFPCLIIKGVPCISQFELNHTKNEGLCSPTACSMLLGYARGCAVDPTLVAQKVYDSGLRAYGSWPFNTAHIFEYLQGKYIAYVARLKNFEALYQFLKKEVPVVVSVRGFLPGAPKEYPNGHLLVVIGWDKKNKKVVCHDPAFKTNVKTLISYDLKSFLAAWERSHRLAYCIETCFTKK